MRLIDADQLIEDIMSKPDECNLFRWRSAKKIKEGWAQIIRKQPEIKKWIPCSEQLPEESLNSVIGWDEYRKRCCFVQYYGGRWIFGNDIESVKITAWQPLPEPYKS